MGWPHGARQTCDGSWLMEPDGPCNPISPDRIGEIQPMMESWNPEGAVPCPGGRPGSFAALAGKFWKIIIIFWVLRSFLAHFSYLKFSILMIFCGVQEVFLSFSNSWSSYGLQGVPKYLFWGFTKNLNFSSFCNPHPGLSSARKLNYLNIWTCPSVKI